MVPEVVEKSAGSGTRKGFNLIASDAFGADTVVGEFAEYQWTFTKVDSGWQIGDGEKFVKFTPNTEYRTTATLETEGDTFTIGGSANLFTFDNGNGSCFNWNESRGMMTGLNQNSAPFYLYELVEEDGSCKHKLVHFDAVEAGCHSNGNIEYWFCADCEGFWQDEALTQLTNSKNVVLPATGSENVTHFEAVEPGCHYNGNIEYWFCADCEGFWQDEALTQLTNSKNVILPATDDGDVQHVEAKDPTCSENGNIEYWFCSKCEKFWQDEALTQLTNSKNVIIAATGCLAKDFPDVVLSEWYHNAVDFAVGNGYMKGDAAGTFRPTDPITRAEMAQILYNAEGAPEFTADKTFSDVTEADWFYNAVMWAASEGLVKGDPTGTYRPEDKITREEMITIIWRYQGSEEPTSTELTFVDAAEAYDWAVTPIAWGVENGVVKGVPGNKFEPKANTERAAIAQVLLNMFG